MGCGDFAVVPAALIEEGSEACFLTSQRRGAEVVTHTVGNGLALVYNHAEPQYCHAEPQYYHAEPQRAQREVSGSPTDSVCHEVEPLLVEALGRKESCVNVALYDGRLYVVVVQRGNLLMANRYRVECGEDVLYHVMNAYERFGMDVMRERLYVCGGVETTLLKKYIACVETEHAPSVQLNN